MKLKNKKPEITPEQEGLIKYVEQYMKFHHLTDLSRRRFLRSSALLGSASLLLPSGLSLLSRQAMAAECATANTKMPGILVINLEAGAGLSGNAVPLDASGGFLSHYGQVGLGSSAFVRDNVSQPFGTKGPYIINSDATTRGGFVDGIRIGATPTTIDKTAMLTVNTESNNDTANEPLNPTALFSKVVNGSNLFLPPLGSNRNASAVYNQVPTLPVNSLDSIRSAIGINGSIDNLTADQKSRITNIINRLSETQVQKLSNMSGGELLSNLVTDTTQLNAQLISNPNGVDIDPRNITGLANVWNFNDTRQLRDAALVVNTLKGHAIMANISIGGRDAHTYGIVQRYLRDSSDGSLVGRALETAAIMGEKLCVIVTTDGSIGYGDASNSNDPATPANEGANDSAQHSMAYMFFFDPTKRPDQTSSQLGHYANAGGISVAENTLVHAPQLGTAAMVANYLSFAKQAGLYAAIAPREHAADSARQQLFKVFG